MMQLLQVKTRVFLERARVTYARYSYMMCCCCSYNLTAAALLLFTRCYTTTRLTSRDYIHVILRGREILTPYSTSTSAQCMLS